MVVSFRSLALLTLAATAPAIVNAQGVLTDVVCRLIDVATSSASGVYFPGSPEYAAAIFHAIAPATQPSVCAFLPASAEDLSRAIRIIGLTRTKFAVKCGGHAQNSGFSSTPGVQIHMKRINNINYDADDNFRGQSASGTVKWGTGLIWDRVHEYLDPLNVTVVGGRFSGVGSAGFTLGGGLSFYSNQHGLAVDNVLEFELVTPTGAIRTVNAESDADLFWAIKGGGNNLGIVTQFTFKAVKYTQVWGGQIIHSGSQFAEYSQLLLDFQDQVTDPKVGMLPTFSYASGQPYIITVAFYDGPEPPAGTFDRFLNLTPIAELTQTTKMLPLLASTEGDGTGAVTLACTNSIKTWVCRNAVHNVMLSRLTPQLLATAYNETVRLGTSLPPDVRSISYGFNPFFSSYLRKTDRTSDSAWPPANVRAAGAYPLGLSAVWTDPALDDSIRATLGDSVDRIQGIVGPKLPRYPNYAPKSESLETVYGDNLQKLRRVARRVDPAKVMSLTGGFTVQR